MSVPGGVPVDGLIGPPRWCGVDADAGRGAPDDPS